MKTSAIVSKQLLIVFVSLVCSIPSQAQFSNPPEIDSMESHPVGSGFLIANSKYGNLRFAPYVTIRYLNQMQLNDTYTDAFGQTHSIRKRNDIQLQKVTLYFKGWIGTPQFRYFTYIWTSNTSQGQGAQLVLGGSLQYQINKHFDIGAGIGPLPTTRSLYGQWPFWLRQDARPMAEEYFRGSFTTGVWVQGEIVKGLNYKTMLGNNLSQLGIDAGQLDNSFDTWSTALWWTTRDFGQMGPYGDFERHEKPATILGGSFTRSNESRQSQPGTDAPENSQIRLSDGTSIFAANALAPNTQVQKAKYQMASFNGGIKFKGFSLDAEYYVRWVSDFIAISQTPTPIANLFDDGFSIQASAMVIRKTLQIYSTGSYINGQYGTPSEITLGLNWYPLKSRILRVNPEVMFEDNSPVGYNSYPTVVGAKGVVYMVNVELFY
jgi:hypothetical protein